MTLKTIVNSIHFIESCLRLAKTFGFSKHEDSQKEDDVSQHDELEPNLKKILQTNTNGIWGLEATVI